MKSDLPQHWCCVCDMTSWSQSCVKELIQLVALCKRGVVAPEKTVAAGLSALHMAWFVRYLLEKERAQADVSPWSRTRRKLKTLNLFPVVKTTEMSKEQVCCSRQIKQIIKTVLTVPLSYLKGTVYQNISFHPFTTHLNVDGGSGDIFIFTERKSSSQR